jgi:predicted ATP-grasp superfamily ATP-dependent carboligase
MVKPRATGVETAHGLVSRKPVLVRSERERDAAVAELVDTAGEALVEEQILGEAWRVHFVRDGSRTVTMALHAIRSYPLRTGPGSLLRVEPPPPGLCRAAEALLQLVDYRGPGSVQVIVRDGRYFVHDVNLRLPLNVGGTIRAGFDMPRLAVESALGRPLDPGPIKFKPVTYVHLESEVRHLRDGVHGRETGASVPRIAGDLLLAAVAPNRVLDPFHLRDPVPMIEAPFAAWRRSRRRSPNRPEQPSSSGSLAAADEGRELEAVSPFGARGERADHERAGEEIRDAPPGRFPTIMQTGSRNDN